MRTSPSTRRRVKASTSARSRSGSSPKLAPKTAVCRSQAARLDRAVDRRGERVVDRVEEETERERLPVAPAERAGALVGREVQRHDRLLHLLAGGDRYVRLVVDHPGDGLDADTGQRGDVTDGGAAAVAREACGSVTTDPLVLARPSRRDRDRAEVDTTPESILEMMPDTVVMRRTVRHSNEGITSMKTHLHRPPAGVVGSPPASSSLRRPRSRSPPAPARRPPAAPARAAAGGGTIAVTLITKTSTNPFFLAMKKGAEDEAAKDGVTLTYAAGAADGDEDGQVKAIEAAVARGDKGILITPNGPGVNSAINKARKQGLYVIALDTPPDPGEHRRHHLRHRQLQGRRGDRQVGGGEAGRQAGQHRAARPLQRQGRLRRLRPRPGLPDRHGHRHQGRQEERRRGQVRQATPAARAATTRSPATSPPRVRRTRASRPWRPACRRPRTSTSSTPSTSRPRPVPPRP